MTTMTLDEGLDEVARRLETGEIPPEAFSMRYWMERRGTSSA